MKNTSTSKRARYAFALLPAALLALSACEGDFTTDDTTTATPSPVMESTTVESAPEPAPELTDDDISEMAMESTLSDSGINLPAGFARQYAQIICEGFEDGLSPMHMVRITTSTLPDYSQTEHASMIGASVGAFCPEFSYQFGATA